ncbi:hypothetical protein [Methanofollis fontis]|uniref:Uncharacterized protein n=1 Tax=Methanofollis fontis TaxID=2052832 RepID=A0A483CRC0_9EURY|nr:hypothetical protein [Methanofollis fontis]TAJ43871.1 hypothetical protein CUJ86_07345 [Methanofollis fontis]
MNTALQPGADDTLQIVIGRHWYEVGQEEIRPLLLFGRPVPLTHMLVQRREDGGIYGRRAIGGYAALNRCGCSVRIFTTSGCFIIPLVSFRRVARGEAVSAPLFPLVAEGYP